MVNKTRKKVKKIIEIKNKNCATVPKNQKINIHKEMESWSTEEVISANHDIDENGFSINAQDDLFTFFEKFAKVKAEYCNSTNEFRVDKKAWFLDAQKAFYNYAARISDFLVNNDQPMQVEGAAKEKVSAQLVQKEKKTKGLTYEECRRIVQPVLNLEKGILTNQTMREISEAITRAQANAKEANYVFTSDMEQTIIAMVHEKFDTVTKSIWEYQIKSLVPSFINLDTFLHNRAEMVQGELRNRPPVAYEHVDAEPRRRQIWCAYCKLSTHTIFKCDRFDTLIIKAKIEFLQRDGRCFNCLSQHGRNPCPSGPCRTCDEPHNSVLCKRNPKNMV